MSKGRRSNGRGHGEPAYHDEVELEAVQLAGLALELDADSLHRLRGQAEHLGGAGVVAVHGDLADVNPDDLLHVWDKVLRDQTFRDDPWSAIPLDVQVKPASRADADAPMPHAKSMTVVRSLSKISGHWARIAAICRPAVACASGCMAW